MYKQVCDYKYRIIFIFSDINTDFGSVFLYDHSVKRERGSKPLIFLDASIVMSIEICHLIRLIERILFDIDSWRINVSSKDIHSVFQRFFTDLEKKNHLAHERCVNLVAFL